MSLAAQIPAVVNTPYGPAVDLRELRRLVDEVRSLTALVAVPPLNLERTGAGYILRYSPATAGGSTPAKWIRFHLSGTLAATDQKQDNVTVDAYWQGADPGSTVTVYNTPASVNFMFSGTSGKVGLASYDDINGKYWIVQMEC